MRKKSWSILLCVILFSLGCESTGKSNQFNTTTENGIHEKSLDESQIQMKEIILKNNSILKSSVLDLKSFASSIPVSKENIALGIVKIYSLNSSSFPITTYPIMSVVDLDLSDRYLIIGGSASGVSIFDKKNSLWNYYSAPTYNLGNYIERVSVNEGIFYLDSYGTGTENGKAGIFYKTVDDDWKVLEDEFGAMSGTNLKYKVSFCASKNYQVQWRWRENKIRYSKDSGATWNDLKLLDETAAQLEKIGDKNVQLSLFENYLLIEIMNHLYLYNLNNFESIHLNSFFVEKDLNSRIISEKISNGITAWVSIGNSDTNIINIWNGTEIKSFNTFVFKQNKVDFVIGEDSIYYYVANSYIDNNKIYKLDIETLSNSVLCKAQFPINSIDYFDNELAVSTTDSSIYLVDLLNETFQVFSPSITIPNFIRPMFTTNGKLFLVYKDSSSAATIDYLTNELKYDAIPQNTSMIDGGHIPYTSEELISLIGTDEISDIAETDSYFVIITYSQRPNWLKLGLIRRGSTEINKINIPNEEYFYAVESFGNTIYASTREKLYIIEIK